MNNNNKIIFQVFSLLLATACFCIVIFHISHDLKDSELSLDDRVPCSTLSINIPMNDYEVIASQDSFNFSPEEKPAAYFPAILEPYKSSFPGCIWQPPKIFSSLS